METLKISVKDIIKGTIAKFIYVQNNVMYYKVENDTHVYIFPVDLNDKSDIGDARFEAEYKAITLMRYINKAIKNDTLAFYEKK